MSQSEGKFWIRPSQPLSVSRWPRLGYYGLERWHRPENGSPRPETEQKRPDRRLRERYENIDALDEEVAASDVTDKSVSTLFENYLVDVAEEENCLQTKREDHRNVGTQSSYQGPAPALADHTDCNGRNPQDEQTEPPQRQNPPSDRGRDPHEPGR